MMRLLVVALLLSLLGGCASSVPRNTGDICAIFYEKDGFFDNWYDAADDAETRWEIPIPVMMATIRQESGFRAKAKPPRRRILWIIPWRRPSSAYGYAQVLDTTWQAYKEDSGSVFASRADFEDAIDFVGWYHYRSAKQLGIPRHDAYRLYLAYHEGQGGYKRGTWTKKPWLIDVARKVDGYAKTYSKQLSTCREDLDDPWWWPF
jgi:hypothetical protein